MSPQAEPWARKYTDAQRTAIFQASIDRGVEPYARVAHMAKEGELTLDGEPVARFDIPAATLADLVRSEKRKRAGIVRGRADTLPHRSAVDHLRARLVAVASAELERLERIQKRPQVEKREIPGDQLRQLARALREIAAIPEKNAAVPTAPGAIDPATGRKEPETQKGLAGNLLRSARNEGQKPGAHAHDTATPRADTSHTTHDQREEHASSTHAHTSDRATAQNHERPGSARAL